MNRSVKAWHVLLAGPVVQFVVGVAVFASSPTVRDAGFVGSHEAVALAFHGFLVVTAAVVAGAAAVVPLVLLALGRLRRVAALLSGGLAVVFGLVPPEPHPATVGPAVVFALAAVLAWREAGRAGAADGADESPDG